MLSPKYAPRILLCLVLLTALVWLYHAPSSAANLEPVPDATEYAVSAQRIALYGKFDIVINGHSYPPRYPVWFPLLLLSPIYYVAPANLGAGIFSVLACGLVSIGFAYRLGKRLGGEAGGVLSALFLLSNLSFLMGSRQIMSDVPAMMCGLVALWLFVNRKEEARPKELLLISTVCGLGFALRNLYAALLLPFLVMELRRSPRNLKKPLLMLLVPLLFFVATALYNQQTFGNWRRTGYHYWCSIPYDYLLLTFHPRFLLANLRSFASMEGLFLLGGGGVGLWRLLASKRQEVLPILVFAGLSALPITVIHLFYFAGGLRFHLLLLAILAVLGGGGIGGALEARFPKLVRFEAWVILLVVAMLAMPLLRQEEALGRYANVTALSQALPTNAVLITNTDAVYLEPLLVHGTQREVLPLTRRAEYASKVIVRQKVPVLNPPPLSSVEHRAPALLQAGAEEALPHTAEELDYVAAKLREGKPVFMDISTAPPTSPAVVDLRTRFRLTRDESGLLVRVEMP